MAIYVTADLHGYPLRDFLDMLRKSGFSDDDYLFVLGDVIDRNGDGGIAMLNWMMDQPNVELLLGNHEKLMLDSAFVFDEITEESADALNTEKLDALSCWMFNGGDVTLETLKKLRKSDPDRIWDILSYLEDAPLFDSVEAGGRDFLLVHAGLGGFSKEKKLSAYTPEELLWTRPELQDSYFDDVMTILGHTPTQYYGEAYAGRAIKTPTWMDIDVGAGHGGRPMLLRLDDMREFYFDAP